MAINQYEAEPSTTLNEHYQKLGYTRFSSFSTLIDVEDFISEDQVFITRDLRIGRMYRLDPLMTEALSDEAKQFVAYQLSRAISELPEGVTGQLITYRHTDIESRLGKFQDIEPSEINNIITKSILGTQRRGASNGFFSDVTDNQLLEARHAYLEGLNNAISEHSEEDDEEVVGQLGGISRGAFPLVSDMYLTICFEPQWKTGVESLRQLLNIAADQVNGQRVSLRRYQKLMVPIKESLEVLEQRLIAEEFGFSIANKQDMEDLLFRELNPERVHHRAAHKTDNGSTIAEALAERMKDVDFSIPAEVAQTPVELNTNGWRIGKYHYAATTVKAQPEETRPNMLGKAFSKVEGEGWISINFSVMKQSSVRRLLAVRNSILDKQWMLSDGPKLFAPDKRALERRQEQMDTALNAINPEEEETQKALMASFTLVCKSRNKRVAQRRAKQLEIILWDKGIREEHRGDAFIHSTLPFQFRSRTDMMLGRGSPMLAANMCDMFDMYTGFPGVPDGRLLFNNSHGAPIYLDPFTSETNAPHGLVVGGTGTGKSFFVNNMIIRMWAQYKPKGFVIDKGRSYESTILALGGEYVVLVPQEQDGYKPRCFNPFFMKDTADGVPLQPTAQQVDDIRSCLVAMLKSGTSNEDGITEEVNKSEKAFLMHEITALLKSRKAGEQKTMTDFANQLTASDNPLGLDLATRLGEYWGTGIYAQLFDGEMDIDFSNQLIGIELDKMSESPALDVLLLCLFNIIEATVKNDLPVDMKKFLFIDEAHKVLAKSYLAPRVAGFYRELRKFRCACLLISQSVKDFNALAEAGRNEEDGVLDNTQHLYLLGVNSQDMALCRKLFDLSDVEGNTWSQSRSAPPYFSELFYLMRHKSNRNFAGLVRLYSDPVSLIMCSTDPDDIAARKEAFAKYKETGMSDADATIHAIQEVSQQYRYGVKHAA